ncbi:MAG TPA: 2Fe-2S iron-sulfur cluster-binding protein, partial [Acidimicrobiia bacterium]
VPETVADCSPAADVHAFLLDHPAPTDDEIKEGLSGNVCRCTGYQGIPQAARRAAGVMSS